MKVLLIITLVPVIASNTLVVFFSRQKIWCVTSTQKVQTRKLIIRLIYNRGQYIWHKVKKSSKIGQDFKNLLSNFACFLTAVVKV